MSLRPGGLARTDDGQVLDAEVLPPRVEGQVAPGAFGVVVRAVAGGTSPGGVERPSLKEGAGHGPRNRAQRHLQRVNGPNVSCSGEDGPFRAAGKRVESVCGGIEVVNWTTDGGG